MDVACIGLLVADIFGKPIDEIPEFNRLVLFDTVEVHTGGCAANTGRDLVKLGLKVGVGGCVGKDLFGRFMIDELTAAGLDTAGIVADSTTNTAVTFALISSDGRRRFITNLGGNNVYSEKHIDLSQYNGARVLHVAGTLLLASLDGEPLSRVLSAAKKDGFITSIDTVFRNKTDCFELFRPSFPYMDIFIPSIEEAEKITGKTSVHDIIHFFDPFKIPIVGVKLGEKGCYLKRGEEEVFVPAFDVEPVDVSGAGDAFFAGFIYAYLQGWDLEAMGKFGNAVAACAIKAIGCTEGVTGVEAAMDVMNHCPVKKIMLE